MYSMRHIRRSHDPRPCAAGGAAAPAQPPHGAATVRAHKSIRSTIDTGSAAQAGRYTCVRYPWLHGMQWLSPHEACRMVHVVAGPVSAESAPLLSASLCAPRAGDGCRHECGRSGRPVILGDAALGVQKLVEVDRARAIQVGKSEEALELQEIVCLARLLAQHAHDHLELIEIDHAVTILVNLAEEGLELVELIGCHLWDGRAALGAL
mmetsp:Transcript_31651/g.86543  ORF Transcript_31651/g.86543 Transcript_31651/m.86543 type:complete len:208 (-) Transcript_31651:410-1033(-)